MIVSVSKYLKAAHVISCVAITVLSSVLIPLCVLLWDTFHYLDELVYKYVTLLPIVIGTISLALFVLSLVGIWAAVVGSVGFFRLYTFSLTLVLLGKVLWMATSSDLQMDFILALDTAFAWHMERYQFQPSVMDNVQWRMNCCGKDTPADWFTLTGYIPASCCHNNSDVHMYAQCMVPEELYLVPPTGCLRLIRDMPKQYYFNLQLMFHVCSVVLVFSLCVSYFMGKACSRYKNEYFFLRKNIIEGKSSYVLEDNSRYTLLKRKLSSLNEFQKTLSKRSLSNVETETKTC